LVRDLRVLGRVVDQVEPDVVHLHSSKAGLGRVVLRGRRPTIFQPHAWSHLAVRRPASDGLRQLERVAARWADAIVCCSDEERATAAAGGIDGHFHVVRNAVDLHRFEPGDRVAARARLGIGDEPVALCVGRLSHQKGQDVLLRTWRGVVGALPQARLVLVGDGPDRAALEADAAAGVIFAGAREDVSDWLAASDVFTLLSRYEGMSLAVLEAMAMARPVVVTAVQGMAEVVGEGPGAGGAVVAVGDELAAGAALIARLADPDLAGAEGRRARARIEEGHDLRQWSEALCRLTEQVAQR
jgi:glycosyltransferase involved in cell wall biosynthesis